MIVVAPARQDCANNTENCAPSKCCKTSGYFCYHRDSSYGQCGKKCPKAGWACNTDASWKTLPVVYKPGTALYCYSVYIEAKVTPSEDHQLELLQMQAKFGVSIFACDVSEVFSDVAITLPNGHTSTKVDDKDGEFKKLTRKDKPNKYVNTPVFYQVWQAIKAHELWKKDWVVKADPTTVFVPSRLVGFLASQAETANGDYYENCFGVDSGFFGNLEVVNYKAFETFLERVTSCKASLCWTNADDCTDGWKYGPWGEDLFMQRCMDKHDVAKLTNYRLAISGTCPADRPADQKSNKNYVPTCRGATAPAIHPFKTPQAYFGCLGTMTGQNYA